MYTENPYAITKNCGYAKREAVDETGTVRSSFRKNYLYLFATPPEWRPNTPEASAVPPAERRDQPPLWSGHGELATPPPQGAIVKVRMNNIGRARVLGYFVEHGYLGMLVQPESPPEWFVKQNGAQSPCHVFGNECEAA